MATLELLGLRKSFGLIDVLQGIDLALADGEMLVIAGALGCGKSTTAASGGGARATHRRPGRLFHLPMDAGQGPTGAS
jgi:ABC-type sugar transport system ATPase subunit